MSRRLFLPTLSFLFLSVFSFFAFYTASHATPPLIPVPKFVTLRSDKLTLTQALAEVTKQTSIRLQASQGLPDRPLHLDLKHTPFWQAVDAIAAAANARVNLYPTSGRIVLNQRDENYHLPPIAYDGRFRLCIKKVTTSRELETNRGATHITLEVAWDTELQPLYLETRPHAVRLVDEKGNKLAVPDEGSSFAPVNGLIALNLDLHLPSLPRGTDKINSLHGRLSMIGPSKMLTFHFDRLDKIAEASANDPERYRAEEGVACRILDVKLLRDHWTVQLALDYPPGLKHLDSNQSWVVNNELTLVSLDGKKHLASSSYVLESATMRRAVLSYHFLDKGASKRGKPREWKLSYRTPANLIEMPISFTFKDIPLP